MQIRHVVEREDGSVVIQGVLEGKELAFVIEMGIEAIIQAGAFPFVSTEQREKHDIYDLPETEQ